MQAYQENISAKVSGVLSPILGVSVTVTDTATGLPATLYSDNGVTQIAQPLVTDETGYFSFYAANGSYTVKFSSPQIAVGTRKIELYDRDDDAPLTQAQAASPTGASGIGYGQRTVANKLDDVVSVKDFGAVIDNATDDGPAFNKAILKLALAGGGALHAAPGTYKVITSILLPSNVTLDLSGCTINGNGANTLIRSGALVAGALTDITTEYGTLAQGAGTHFVGNARVVGGTLGNAACGIRAHRFNYGSTIEHVTFAATLANSYISSHSWGLKVHQNTIYAPAIMKDFVDWTEVSGNSFEGPYGTTPAALTIATGGYGGSYSAIFRSNGFHHWSKGIEFTCEATNPIIEDCHFEDVVLHVSGGAQTVQRARIQNNWMKANLATPGGCIGISFASMWDSDIGPNYQSTDGASNWDARVVLSNSNCFGNRIVLPYSPSGALDVSQYQINDANEVLLRGGSNNPALTQPIIERASGSGSYTVEKYKSRYHAIANTIPYCTVAYNAGAPTVDTWITADAYGTAQLVAFNFVLNGSSAYRVSGFINGLAVTVANQAKMFGSGGALVIAASNNGGKLRITVTGADAGGNITGWVKEL